VRLLRGLLGGMLALAAALAYAQGLKPWSGAATPALQLEDADGAMHSLTDYRGKVVLVNFWATWCVPCREEMPSIESLRRTLEGKPFAVLAVNVGESARVARSFGQKLDLGFALLLDRDTRVAKAWSARVLPASYLIGPDGKIRYSYLGELDWSSAEVRARIEMLMPKDPVRKASR
jgi:peroxiredoxin